MGQGKASPTNQDDEKLRLSPKQQLFAPTTFEDLNGIENPNNNETEHPTIKLEVTSDRAVEGFEDQEEGHEDLDRNFRSSGIFLDTNPSRIENMIETEPI